MISTKISSHTILTQPMSTLYPRPMTDYHNDHEEFDDEFFMFKRPSERGHNNSNNSNNSNNNSTNNEIPLEEWVPDRAIDAINMERQLHPEFSETQLANKLLKENLPLIAAGVTHTAKYAKDPRLRFQAQIYVMDRVLGKVGVNNLTDNDPMDELFTALMTAVDEAVNK